MRLAVFDIDGTLVNAHTERAFWHYMWRARAQGPRQLLSGALGLACQLPIGGIHAPKKNKAYLAGLRCDHVNALAEAFIAGWIDQHWNGKVVTRLEQHRHAGDRVILLSGTLDCLARAIARRLVVTDVCATLPAVRDGIYRLRSPSRHPFGNDKLTLTRGYVAKAGIDFGSVTAYGDSRFDLPLLKAVGEPVAVSPDRALRAVAFQRRWEILDADDGQQVTTAL